VPPGFQLALAVGERSGQRPHHGVDEMICPLHGIARVVDESGLHLSPLRLELLNLLHPEQFDRRLTIVSPLPGLWLILPVSGLFVLVRGFRLSDRESLLLSSRVLPDVPWFLGGQTGIFIGVFTVVVWLHAETSSRAGTSGSVAVT
jgi:hypothetical protein